jgi:uncharacterized protein involved in exopolysaccharide biosynthesis
MAPDNSAELDLEKLFYRLILTVKRFLYLILGLVILGGLAGYFYSTLTKKVYGAKMLVSSYILTQSYTKEMADKLNLFIKEGNIQVITEKLNIPENVAKDLVSISADKALEDVHLLTEEERNFSQINAQMTRPEGFAALEKGLLYYFEHNQYYIQKSTALKKGYLETIAAIDKEIAILDEVNKSVTSGQAGNPDALQGLGYVLSGIGPAMEQKMIAHEALAKVDGIHVIDGFTPFARPQWPKKSTSIVLGIGLGLILAGIIIIIKLINERMAKGIDNI